MPPLLVLLRVDDQPVLGQGDPTPNRGTHRRPEFGRQNLCREPPQTQGQIVEAAQEVIRALGASPQHGDKILGGRFDECAIAERIKCRLAHGAVVASLRFGFGAGNHLGHDTAPGALDHPLIVGTEVSPGQGQVEAR